MCDRTTDSTKNSSVPGGIFKSPLWADPAIFTTNSHIFWVKNGCPPVQTNISLRTSCGLGMTFSTPFAKGCASSKLNPDKSIACPILKGVRFLSAIKSLGVATPKIAKVIRLYNELMQKSHLPENLSLKYYQFHRQI